MPPPPDLILVTTCHATQDTASAASCTPTPGTSCGCSKNIATRVYSVRGLKPSADVAKAFRAQLIQDVGHSAELPLLSLEIDTSRNVVKIQWHANDAPASMEVCPCCFCESGYEQCRGPGPLSQVAGDIAAMHSGRMPSPAGQLWESATLFTIMPARADVQDIMLSIVTDGGRANWVPVRSMA